MRKPVYECATIVIPTYNRMVLLDQTLRSLVDCSTPKSQFQVLICDDGSSDDTKAVVECYRQSLDLDYEFQENFGFRVSQARNMALSAAKYPLLIFLDCGVAVSTNFINAHVRAHQKSKHPCAYVGYVYGFDRNNENQAYLKKTVSYENIDASIKKLASDGCLDIREEIYRLVDDDFTKLPVPWALMWGCNFSVELDVMRIVGGFNPNFTTWGGEDQEFGYKLHRCGVNIALCREATAIHLPHHKDGDLLAKQSDSNLARETRHYNDPMIAIVLQYGDFGANAMLCTN